MKLPQYIVVCSDLASWPRPSPWPIAAGIGTLSIALIDHQSRLIILLALSALVLMVLMMTWRALVIARRL